MHLKKKKKFQETSDVERSKWFNTLIVYALDPKETEDTLRRDPDAKLIPTVIEKIVLPKLKSTYINYFFFFFYLKINHKFFFFQLAIVDKIWDPMSTTQTLQLVKTVKRFIQEYPNLNETSKQLEELFNTILEKIQAAVENDVFIPIFHKQ